MLYTCGVAKLNNFSWIPLGFISLLQEKKNEKKNVLVLSMDKQILKKSSNTMNIL